MKKIFAIICTMMLLLSLTACGKGGGNEKLAGTYKFASMGAGGETMTREQFVEMGVTEEEIDAMFTLELKSDGSLSITADGDTASGTYKDGKMTIDGDDLTYEFKDGKLTLNMPGEEPWNLIFDKQ